jgi:hypothetical protein
LLVKSSNNGIGAGSNESRGVREETHLLQKIDVGQIPLPDKLNAQTGDQDLRLLVGSRGWRNHAKALANCHTTLRITGVGSLQ